MNNGADTAAYLAAGCRVVAVEADPQMADRARVRFAAEIAAGVLTVVDRGVSRTDGEEQEFWVSDRSPLLSSFSRAAAERYGSSHPITIRTITIGELLRLHGVPDYLKIDIEGYDEIVLEQLARESARPRFISVEGYGMKSLDDLLALGYREFQWVPQRHYEKDEDGLVCGSGPWGEGLPGPWLTADEVRLELAAFYDVGGLDRPGNLDWYDLHARMGG
jgi:FkbM family methyltransferase